MLRAILLAFIFFSLPNPANAFLSDYFSTPKTSYILALSWSPTYCAGEAVQKNRQDGAQCAAAKPFSFIVHGLWMQDKNRDCKNNGAQLSPAQIISMKDLMPDDGLIKHQWRKHGVCTGKTADAYFKDVRSARQKIIIPQVFNNLSSPITFTKNQLKEQFQTANPTLQSTMFNLTCRGNRLKEVRVCMNETLDFEDCLRMQDSCSNTGIYVPPVR